MIILKQKEYTREDKKAILEFWKKTGAGNNPVLPDDITNEKLDDLSRFATRLDYDLDKGKQSTLHLLQNPKQKAIMEERFKEMGMPTMSKQYPHLVKKLTDKKLIDRFNRIQDIRAKRLTEESKEGKRYESSLGYYLSKNNKNRYDATYRPGNNKRIWDRVNRERQATKSHPENEMLYDRLKQTSKVPVFEQGVRYKRKDLNKAINPNKGRLSKFLHRNFHIKPNIKKFDPNNASFNYSYDSTNSTNTNFIVKEGPNDTNFITMGKNLVGNSATLAHEMGHEDTLNKEKVDREGTFKEVLNEASANSRGRQILRRAGASDDYLKQFDKQRATCMEAYAKNAKQDFLIKLSHRYNNIRSIKKK